MSSFFGGESINNVEDRRAISEIMAFAADLTMTYGQEDPTFFRGNKPADEVENFTPQVVAHDLVLPRTVRLG